jgi:hypothetical protein
MFLGDLPGRWWLPGREEDAVAGTLHIAWNEGPRVTAIGFLEPASVETLFRHVQGRFVQYPVVFGRGADGQVLTLVDVRVEIRQAHLDAPGDASIELVACVRETRRCVLAVQLTKAASHRARCLLEGAPGYRGPRSRPARHSQGPRRDLSSRAGIACPIHRDAGSASVSGRRQSERLVRVARIEPGGAR